MTTIRFAHLDGPLGRLLLTRTERGLSGVFFEGHPGLTMDPDWVEDAAALDDARAQLDAYLAGRRSRFELSLDVPRGTAFQRRVWCALRGIAPGRTRTYGELARAIGAPRAARAVGAANARNPLSIVVPCHRVVGAGGRLIGYAGGEARKRWLLDHERAMQ